MGRRPLVILAEILIAFVLVLAERIEADDRTQEEDKSYAECAEQNKYF